MNWMETYSGVKFNLDEPRPEDVNIGDIAHALARQCRFGGGVREFYSVAQHSMMVSKNVPPQYALEGLLHDAAEAFVVDLPTPIKAYFRQHGMNLYDILEHGVQRAIFERFGLAGTALSSRVKDADTRALFTERRDLRGVPCEPWHAEDTHPPYEDKIQPLSYIAAEYAFLERFHMLTGGRERRA